MIPFSESILALLRYYILL